jgi:hypothetical protein
MDGLAHAGYEFQPPPRCPMRALARTQVLFDHADALEAAGLARRV